MSARVVVADYGIGNLFSVCNALRHAGAEPILSGDPQCIATAERLVVPGVGAFGMVMSEFRQRGLVDAVDRFRRTGRPLLGICVGMQMLMDFSLEFGWHEGLGYFEGHVGKIPAFSVSGQPLRVPHVSWAELHEAEHARRTWTSSLFAKLRPGHSSVYFVHSFAAQPSNRGDILTEIEYGGHRIVAAIERNNLIGVQFHPERSGLAGHKFLESFVSW